VTNALSPAKLLQFRWRYISNSRSLHVNTGSMDRNIFNDCKFFHRYSSLLEASQRHLCWRRQNTRSSAWGRLL